MGIPFRYLTGLTGGSAGDLDAVSIDDIQNREMAFVATTDTGYIFVFDSASSDAEHSPDVVAPDDANGPGRWHVQDLGVVGGSDFSYAHFEHQEALGVSGGARTKLVWTPRPYGTTVVNDISSVALSSGDINIPSGKYDFRIIDIQRNAKNWRVKLLNVSSGADIAIGPSVMSGYVSIDNKATVMQGRFTASGARTIGTRIISNNSHTNGMGSPASIGTENEVYGIFELWRVGEA